MKVSLGSLSIIDDVQNLIIFVKYAVEISYFPLFSSRDIFLSSVGKKQSHSVNKCILFEITCM